MHSKKKENLKDRKNKFINIINTDNVYRIPLRFFTDLGLVNFSVKFIIKFIFTLKTNTNKLFEMNIKKQIYLMMSMLILFSIQHPIFNMKINDNYKAYLETPMTSEHALRTDLKKTPNQRSNELNVSVQLFTVNFRDASKQFLFLEISLL